MKIKEQEATLAVAELYHCWLTGLVLSLITHKGAKTASKFVFKLFRHQHLKNFLPGLKKLGLNELPDAVAAAQYHYFSNQLGGVKVEYLKVSERKAWIRYPPPRWIWAGTAICAVPKEVNNQMLRGWHAHNGVSLKNPRLGFVCTKTTVEGEPGLEGYYLEHDHDLIESERLRFSPEESCPYIDQKKLPTLNHDSWPETRRSKAYRNYAMEYIRNALPILIDILGDKEALKLGRLSGRQIGMQCYEGIASSIGLTGSDSGSFIAFLGAFLTGSGDSWTREKEGIRLKTPSKMNKYWEVDKTLQAILNAPLEGLLAAHNRFLKLEQVSKNTFIVIDN